MNIGEKMEYRIKFGEVVLAIQSEREIKVEPELLPFMDKEQGTPDVDVSVSWDWEKARKPLAAMVGQDLIQNYYIEDEGAFCMTRGGPKGYVAGTWYTKDFRKMECAINEKPFLIKEKTLGQILRFLPIRGLLQHFQVLFFHASQIMVGEKGILFSAPSGTGKTTQANLWKQYEGATLVCNDRTLIRCMDGKWKTFGYPIDGSAPVRSSAVNELGCVVYLSQAKENDVERMHGAGALAALMPQLVIDIWSSQSRERTMELLIGLLKDIPIYHLHCTPTKESVDCLKEMLRKDGVLE